MGGRHLSTSIIWKRATEIGIGIAFTNEITHSGETLNLPTYVIVSIIHPKTNICGQYKENITPRNHELMAHDGYSEDFEKSLQRFDDFLYELQPWARRISQCFFKRVESFEKKVN